MRYISDFDYLDYHGENIPADEYDRFAARACEAVDVATGGQIGRAGGPDALPEYTAAQVRLACCAQAEYLYLQGADAALDGVAGSGYQIGKSQVIAGGSSAGGRLPGGLCRKAWQALAVTGLLYTGVGCSW